MPLTNFYDFLGCTVPTILSCTIKDNSSTPVFHPNGLILD